MSRIYTIYRARCLVNGKSYVGFDSAWPKRRIQHERYSGHLRGRFQLALRKHGIESFEWTVVYRSTDGDHTLKVMEPHFIRVFSGYTHGYNSTLGGEGSLGYVATPEAREKISAKNKGKHRSPKSDETKKRMSEAQRGRRPSEEARRKMSEAVRPPITEETRRKISETSRGRRLSEETRAKMSAAKKGRRMTQEQREACRSRAIEAHARLTDEQRERMRLNRGKKLSAETRKKMSESHRRRRTG